METFIFGYSLINNILVNILFIFQFLLFIIIIMNNNISISFLDYISDDIKNINNPIYNHNENFNRHWNDNKLNIILLLNKLYINIQQIIKSTSKKLIDQSLVEHIRLTPIIHKYPILYQYYIDSNINSNIDINSFNDKINKRKIIYKKYIDFKYYIKRYYNLISDNIVDVLDRFQNGIFISLDIKLDVENNIDNCQIYSFEHIDFYIFYKDEQLNKIDLKQLICNIYYISKWIYDMNPIKKITFYYFDITIDKRIINNINYLCSQNINSGLSTQEYIIIWRREEIFKVFIHELIHYLKIDIKHDKKSNNIINYNIGKFNYPILVNETITELQAQFFNTLYILISNDINRSSNEIINLFKSFYNLEQIFSWYQFNKIMNYFKIDKFDIKLIKSNFNQSTNVYSYFILKSIFSMHFFDILYELDYIKELINPNSNEKCLIFNNINRIVNNIPIKFLNNIISNLDYDDDSLRMTIFGYY
jgi:hypothetical protein